jgi:regulator of replication initiation timing
VQAKMSQEQAKVDPIMQQVGLLNLRINDMMTQLNTVVKTLMDENTALQKENADLKAQQEKTTKS